MVGTRFEQLPCVNRKSRVEFSHRPFARLVGRADNPHLRYQVRKAYKNRPYLAMMNQLAFDQDEDVLMMNPDPETAAFEDDDDDFDGGAEFDELGSGNTSGYGEDDLADIDDEEFDEANLDDDLDLDLDDDDLDDDID